MPEEMELAVGSLRGVRAWNADALGRLTGLHRSNYIWKPGENASECGLGCSGLGETCMCGFWAYYTDPGHQGDVYGVIEAYGKTTQGTKGFRAEKARIVALCIPGSGQPKQLSRWDRFSYWMGGLHAKMIPLKATVTAMLIVLGASFSVGLLVEGPRWLAPLSIAAVIAGITGVVAIFHGIDVDLPKQTKTKPRLELVRRNYPDVRFYSNKKQMLKHEELSGPDLPPAPSPDDEDFWTRPVEQPRGEFGITGISTGSRTSPFSWALGVDPAAFSQGMRDAAERIRKQIAQMDDDV